MTVENKKLSFLERIFGPRKAPPIDVRVMPFLDEDEVDHSKTILQALEKLEGIKVRMLRKEVLSETVPELAQEMQELREQTTADMIVWGAVPELGTTLHIHFCVAPPQDEDYAGMASPTATLTLPADFEDGLISTLRLCVLMAIPLKDAEKIKYAQGLLPGFLSEAQAAMRELPFDLTTVERSHVQMFYANALATIAHQSSILDMYMDAETAYNAALKGVSRTDNPLDWAMMQKSLAIVEMTRAERADSDATLLQSAIQALKAALQVLNVEETPLVWAACQSRLATALYRLDLKSGETNGIKQAVVTYQAALKVYSPARTPQLWAEVISGLSLTCQVLGAETTNEALVEKAIAFGRSALEARKALGVPMPLAAAYNTLGSALYQKGKMSGEHDFMEEALTTFAAARDLYFQIGSQKLSDIAEKNMQRAEASIPDSRKPKKPGKDEWWLEEENAAKEEAAEQKSAESDAPADK